jgi:hypothetical protein
MLPRLRKLALAAVMVVALVRSLEEGGLAKRTASAVLRMQLAFSARTLRPFTPFVVESGLARITKLAPPPAPILKPSGPLLLVGILSSPSNRFRRRTLRHTWLNASVIRTGEVRYLFFIGNTSTQVRSEAARHRDIHLLDTQREGYESLVLKTLALVSTATNAGVAFAMKTDDDCLVDIASLVAWLRDASFGQRPLYLGRFVEGKAPCFEKSNRWCIPKNGSVAPWDTYPLFAIGAGYLMSLALMGAIQQLPTKTLLRLEVGAGALPILPAVRARFATKVVNTRWLRMAQDVSVGYWVKAVGESTPGKRHGPSTQARGSHRLLLQPLNSRPLFCPSLFPQPR